MPQRRNSRGPIITSDFFGRASNTALGVTDAVLGGLFGLAWTEEAGDWEINAGRLGSVGSSPGGLGWLAKIDPGFAALQIEVTPQNISANNDRIRFRIQDANNWLCLTHTSTSLAFSDCIAGVITARGTATTGVTPTSGDTVIVDALGSALSAWIVRAGAKVGTAATATIATFASATGVGFRAAAAGTRWKNLIIRRR